jgi:hypothetical protein
MGLSPEAVADAVVTAIRNADFYILTHPEFKEAIRTRMEDILYERNPSTMMSGG